jgi:hypothetical protein
MVFQRKPSFGRTDRIVGLYDPRANGLRQFVKTVLCVVVSTSVADIVAPLLPIECADTPAPSGQVFEPGENSSIAISVAIFAAMEITAAIGIAHRLRVDLATVFLIVFAGFGFAFGRLAFDFAIAIGRAEFFSLGESSAIGK